LLCLVSSSRLRCEYVFKHTSCCNTQVLGTLENKSWIMSIHLCYVPHGITEQYFYFFNWYIVYSYRNPLIFLPFFSLIFLLFYFIIFTFTYMCICYLDHLPPRFFNGINFVIFTFIHPVNSTSFWVLCKVYRWLFTDVWGQVIKYLLRTDTSADPT
jgi:hypothetical protein